jgi:YidC/Oxa1 family membrane protein insertase
MKQDTKNLYMAIGLSCLVVVGWNTFFSASPVDKAHQAQIRAQQAAGQAPNGQTSNGQASNGQAPTAAQGAGETLEPTRTRAQALAESPRVKLDTPALFGSIALKGGRLDDISLKLYRETTDPHSPNIVLLTPMGAPAPYYAETGFLAAAAGENLALPRADTLWQADREALTPDAPVTLSYDNGQGLVFHRKIAVDDRYMFSVTDSVENKSGRAVTLAPYALVARHGLPVTANYSVLHEGFVGVIGASGVQEFKYGKIEKEDRATKTFKGAGGWLGFTDKYWAATVIPDQSLPVEASFSERGDAAKVYRADFVGDAKTLEPGASTDATTRIFAGAKVSDTLDAYQKDLGIEKFDLLIDWGWFYFITRPMFKLLDFLYKFTGNFGVAILLITVIVKTLFFPLANRSYRSMAKMKGAAPQIAAIKARFPDDKHKQQLETMELYKREKINPVSGCLPMLIQIPVFFSLYKVLFVTIEMRQAPFFGWIKDLSRPDPTNVFNLFGLLPIDPTQLPVFGSFLALGIWPLIMGVTMFVQMKTNPEPADEMQKKIFAWMPVVFTFTLGSFPSGLVIYWAWNNTLSVLQQTMIMKRAGVKVELWDNLANMFRKKATS